MAYGSESKAPLKKIGALWKPDPSKGATQVVLRGELELEGKGGPKIKVLIFKNTFKKSAAHPDFEIKTSDEVAGGGGREPGSDDDLGF